MSEERKAQFLAFKASMLGALGLNPDGSKPEGIKFTTRLPPKKSPSDQPRNNPIIVKPLKQAEQNNGHREDSSSDDGGREPV